MRSLPNEMTDRQWEVQNEGAESLEVAALIHPCNRLSEHMADATVFGPLDDLRNRYFHRSHLIGWMCLPAGLIIPRAEQSMLY